MSLLTPFLKQRAVLTQGASWDEWGNAVPGESRTIRVRWTGMPKKTESLAGVVVRSLKFVSNPEILTDDAMITVGDELTYDGARYVVSAMEEIRGLDGKLVGKKVWC